MQPLSFENKTLVIIFCGEGAEPCRTNPRTLPRLSLYALRLQTLDLCSLFSPSAIKYGDILPLHTLKLTACPLPWHSSFNLTGVTTLFLRHIPSSCLQSPLEFLATLNGIQALVVLHLENTFPYARGLLSSGAFDVFAILSLPCLARLFVAAPLSTVAAFLSCVNIPSKTQLELQIESEVGSSMDDYAQLPSVLAQRFNRPKDPASSNLAIRSLVIDLSLDDFTIAICASECGDCDLDLSK